MTTEMVRYVGLDVHKRVVEACLVDRAGQIVHRERFTLNRRVLELFATEVLRPTDQVALEATTNCWAVADALRPHVARVIVSNPLATKAIAQAKVKTDKVDACVLAQLLRCEFLPEVWQPDEATRRLRELTGRRSALVGQRTAMRNRIHSVLAMRLVEPPIRFFHAAGLAWLATVQLDDQARLLVDSDLRQLEFLQREIDTLDAELTQRGHASAAVRLLMTLPGVDVATAEAMLAAWGDAGRFPDGDHAASYLGLVPSKGSKCTAKLPGGSRTIRSLGEICQAEGLPSPKALSRGEQRTVARAGCQALVEQVAHRQIVSRRRTPAQAPSTTPSNRCVKQPRTRAGASCEAFRQPRAGEQGDEAPPPAPPTLFPVPGRKTAAPKKSSRAS